MRAVARQPCDRSIIANEKVLEVVMSDDHNVKKQKVSIFPDEQNLNISSRPRPLACRNPRNCRRNPVFICQD